MWGERLAPGHATPAHHAVHSRRAYNLNVGEVFAELMKVGRDVRKAAYRDPEWRARAFDDLETNATGMKPRWETYEVSETERFPELVGRRVTDIANERDCTPFDVMCDLSLAEDLGTRFRANIANDDPDAVARLLTEDHVVLGLTDAGAHVDQLCDAPLPPTSSATGSASRVMPLERAIRKLTGEPAEMFGFDEARLPARGRLRRRDVFDPTTVAPGPLERVRDLPANGERLTAEQPVGMRHVLVNGSLIRRDGAQLQLEDLPGERPQLA